MSSVVLDGPSANANVVDMASAMDSGDLETTGRTQVS